MKNLIKNVEEYLVQSQNVMVDILAGRYRFAKLSENSEDKYLDSTYSFLDILLTTSGYERVPESAPTDFGVRCGFPVYVLPNETRNLIFSSFVHEVVHFEFDGIFPGFDDEISKLPKADRICEVGNVIPIKMAISIKNKKFNFSGVKAKELGIRNEVWFLGQKTKDPHKDFLTQPRLLQKLMFDYQVAIAFAVAYESSWPNVNLNDLLKQGLITYPIDTKRYRIEKQKIDSVKKKKTISHEINRTTGLSENCDMAKYCSKAMNDCRELHSDVTGWTRISYGIKQAFTYWRDDLVQSGKNIRCEQINDKDPLFLGIIRFFSPCPRQHFPPKGVLKEMGYDDSRSYNQYCTGLLYEVFPECRSSAKMK